MGSPCALTDRNRFRHGPDIGRQFRYNISEIQRDGFALIVRGKASVPEETRPCFRRLHELARRLSRQAIGTISLKELSMGISYDDHVAVDEEATMVRLVSATFGVWRA